MKDKKTILKPKSDGGYSKMSSLGAYRSTTSNDVSESSNFKKAKEMALKNKSKQNKMDLLLDIEKKFGKALSQKELDSIAKIVSESKGKIISYKEFISYN